MKKIFSILTLFPLLSFGSFADASTLENHSSHQGPQYIKAQNETTYTKKLLEDISGIPLFGQHQAEKREKEVNSNINQKIIDVPLINQNPELKYGCEVTSLAMVLNHAGVNVTKMELYQKIKKDPDPIVRVKGDIIKWGDPAVGYVGDMTGKQAGYAAFDQPMVQLTNHYLPGRAVNLTNKSFEDILNHVRKGYPVVIWTTGDYNLPDRWESWQHGDRIIKTPLDLHVVVLVGFDDNFVYINDPLSGRKQAKVSKERFISSWKALKCRAVSYQ